MNVMEGWNSMDHPRMVEALIGDQSAHVAMYRRSPTFHAGIDQLAAWLPVWIESMAQAAALADRQRAEAIELAKRCQLTDDRLLAMVTEGQLEELRNPVGEST